MKEREVQQKEAWDKMTGRESCDFCGRQEIKFLRELEMDEDGLWVCRECRGRLGSKPAGDPEDETDDLADEIRALVGKSAGAICRTLELPYRNPYQGILDAASAIAYDEDRYMSAWTFVTQWMDGTSVWRSPDRRAKAVVSANGTVRIETSARRG